MAEDEQPESVEEIVRRVLGEQKSHGHRQWGPSVRTAIQVPYFRQNLYTSPNAAVQNVWETVANLRNVTLMSAAFACTIANETLEVETTIDGIVFTQGQAAVFGTNYGNGLQHDYTGAYADPQNPYWVGNATLHAKTVLIRMRKTTAGGASFLRHALAYQQW